MRRPEKAYDIGEMRRRVAGVNAARVADRFSVTPVYAQGMTPYASIYTTLTSDTGDGPLYATGTTNANSGYNCHSVSAYVLLTLPSGHQVGNTDPGGHGEVAQTTASLALSGNDFDIEGTITASTTHNAYRPCQLQSIREQ